MAFTAGDRDRLLADPKAFMDRVAISVGQDCSKPTLIGKPDKLTFADDPNVRGYRQIDIGNDVGMDYVPTYLLRKKNGTDTVWFDAYLVEYEDEQDAHHGAGAGRNSVLHREHERLHVRHRLTGKSVGFAGRDALEQSRPRVAGGQHFRPAAEGWLRRRDRRRLFEPEHSRTHGKQSITFGFRKPGQKWQFCFLSYARRSGIITNYGVRDIVTNQVQG